MKKIIQSKKNKKKFHQNLYISAKKYDLKTLCKIQSVVFINLIKHYESRPNFFILIL